VGSAVVDGSALLGPGIDRWPGMKHGAPHTRDIVVIGSSLGGVAALQVIFANLPADLPASVFVVQHTHPSGQSSLPDILSQRGPLPASHAIHGEEIQRGRVYVAPPDNHLMLRPGTVDVVRGPRENRHRPAVDALFRTAARHYGPRVIGVVLTGRFDCGTAGMISIKARDGITIVQDPDDAQVPDMPFSVLEHVQVDHVVPVAEIAPLIARLSREKAPPWSSDIAPRVAVLEGDQLGVPIGLVCPHCDGALTESTVGGFTLVRCHIGHAFSPHSLVHQQQEQVERALWSAVRALEESATLARRIAAKVPSDLRARYEERARDHDENAERLRAIVLRGGLPPIPLHPSEVQEQAS
jgi:two-component system chemotaxis response regulator CheB